MIRWGILWCTLLISCFATSQQWHAWVYFIDKPGAATAISQPQNLLTSRALQRKARHQIAIDERDVPVHQSYVQQIESSPGITYHTQSKWFNCVHITGSVTDIQSLSNLSFVDRIEFADPTKHSDSSLVLNKWQTTTNAVAIYGNAQTQLQMVDLPAVHQLGYRGNGVTIAVTDSGFPNVPVNTAFNHLRVNNLIKGGYDFVDNDLTYYGDHFHGSRVLSIMAARVPGQYEGAAPEANYYLFRTEDAATETPVELSNWVAAAERADSLGVDVINISLGYLTFDNPAENLTYADLDGQTSFISMGANTAFEKGMIVVASAGNYGTSTTHPYIVSPADATGTIAVGAVNSNRSRVSFSSIGPSADNRIKPDIAAMGGATALVDENQNVVNGNGTSYSAPIISGGIACLVQAFPNKTPSEIRTAVLQSADQYTMPDNTLGYGIPDFDLAFQTLNIPSDKLQKFSYYLKESRLYIHTESSVKADLKIYNLQGKLLLQSLHRGESVVNVNELASGVYIAQLLGYKPIKFVVN